jgi:hypothetical protein
MRACAKNGMPLSRALENKFFNLPWQRDEKEKLLGRPMEFSPG